MKITCVSASNVEQFRTTSASTRTCQLISDLVQAELDGNADIEIIRLVDFAPVPCNMCGSCFKTERCHTDAAFNTIFEKLIASDAVFIVSPHYAPIPSKLVMLFEKMEEIVYLRGCDDPSYRFPLYRKPVGIVAHGGQMEEAVSYYKSALLDPIATALSSVQMQVVGANEQWPYGVAFGVKEITKPNDSIFVNIEHDWDLVEERITPLVKNVLARVIH